jgi:hypothetical protein
LSIGVEISVDHFEPGSGHPGEGGGTLNGGMALRNRFRAHIVDPAIPEDVSIRIAARGGRLVAEEVSVRVRGDGAPVNAASLRRVKVDTYIAKVRAWLEAHDGRGLLVKATELPITQREDLTRQGVGVGPIDQATLRNIRVVQLYRQAYNSSDPRVRAAPTEFVARMLQLSRSYAARLVKEARERGDLGPKIPGRGGEFVVLTSGLHLEELDEVATLELDDTTHDHRTLRAQRSRAEHEEER